MLISPINGSNGFRGTFQVNPLFNKFRSELKPAQKKIFEEQIKMMERENDGRIFKFGRILNPNTAGGAEVGIFEKKTLINDTFWIPLFCSTRENAELCFEQLNNMYKDIMLAKLGKYAR